MLIKNGGMSPITLPLPRVIVFAVYAQFPWYSKLFIVDSDIRGKNGSEELSLLNKICPEGMTKLIREFLAYSLPFSSKPDTTFPNPLGHDIKRNPLP